MTPDPKKLSAKNKKKTQSKTGQFAIDHTVIFLVPLICYNVEIVFPLILFNY